MAMANASVPVPALPEPRDEATQADPLATLAERARADDPDAVREILEGVAPTVFRVVCGVLGRAHLEVDDVTQLGLIEFLKGLRGFRGECRVSSFASRIAFRTAVRARSKSRQAQEREQRWFALQDDEQGSSHPEEVVVERCRSLWRRLLDELPAAQAETLMFRLVLDYSLDETADATGTSFNTVRSRLRLGIENLRRRIEMDPTLVKRLEGP